MWNRVVSIIRQCAWCNKILGGDGKPPVTHGICSDCAKKM